jgi:hypothetical protein
VEPRPEGAKGLAGGFPLHIHTQGAEVPLRLEDDEGSRSPFRVVGSDSFEQCLRVSSNAHVLGDYGLKFCTDHWDFLQWFLSACMGRNEDLRKKEANRQSSVKMEGSHMPRKKNRNATSHSARKRCARKVTCIEERSKTIPESMQIQPHACKLRASAV